MNPKNVLSQSRINHVAVFDDVANFVVIELFDLKKDETRATRTNDVDDSSVRDKDSNVLNNSKYINPIGGICIPASALSSKNGTLKFNPSGYDKLIYFLANQLLFLILLIRCIAIWKNFYRWELLHQCFVSVLQILRL
jgi:hypothetical protein